MRNHFAYSLGRKQGFFDSECMRLKWEKIIADNHFTRLKKILCDLSLANLSWKLTLARITPYTRGIKKSLMIKSAQTNCGHKKTSMIKDTQTKLQSMKEFKWFKESSIPVLGSLHDSLSKKTKNAGQSC